MEIIGAGPEQIPFIRQIAEATWPSAYSAILAPEQISYMLDLFYSEAALLTQMSAGHRFLLALESGRPRGFAGYERNNQPGITKLHKLYVLPSTQGTGLGRMLLELVAQDATAHGQHTLLLNVNRYNKAFHFYTRQGFGILREEDIDIGGGYFMNDYVLQKPLSAAS